MCVHVEIKRSTSASPLFCLLQSSCLCASRGKLRFNNRSNDSLLRGPRIINDSNITGSRSLAGELRYELSIHTEWWVLRAETKRKKTTAPIFFFIFCLWLLVPLSTGSISLMSNIISRWSKHAAVTKKSIVNKLRKYLSSSRTEAVHRKAFKRLK